MTTPSTARKAGPFTGNGLQTSWPFTFKVFAAGDIKVTIADMAGVETVLVLGTNYTVTLNPNQDTSPGGTVTYLLADGSKLTVTGDLDYDQPLDIPAGGNFNPVAFENQLDRMVMQTQQLAEELGRAVKVPVTEAATGQLSTDLANGILALGPIADEVETVAANVAAIDNVSDNMAVVSQVAVNIADVTNFADVYQGPKSSNPTLRNDGGALQPGDLYFNTAAGLLYVYGSGLWAPAATATPVTITPQSFSGNGTTTAFTLSVAPAFDAALDVYISGVNQVLGTNYTVSGTTLTFTVAPPSGTNNINVKILSAYASGAPADGSITTSKLANNAVTSEKIAASSVTNPKLGVFAVGSTNIIDGVVITSKIADGAVTGAKLATGAALANLSSLSITGAYLASNSVTSTKIADANVTTAKIVDAAVTAAKLSGAQSGSAPVYAARAWVNFDGTGTVAVRASGNVTGITDNGVGDYTVNFTTAMPDVNFSVSGTAGNDQTLTNDSGRILGEFGMASRTTSSCRVTTAYVFQGIDTTVLVDSSVVSVAIFR